MAASSEDDGCRRASRGPLSPDDDGLDGDGVLGDGKLGEGRLGDGKLGDGRLGEGKLGDGRLGDGRLGEGRLGDGKLGEGKLGEGMRDDGEGNLGVGSWTEQLQLRTAPVSTVNASAAAIGGLRCCGALRFIDPPLARAPLPPLPRPGGSPPGRTGSRRRCASPARRR